MFVNSYRADKGRQFGGIAQYQPTVYLGIVVAYFSNVKNFFKSAENS